MIKNFQFSVFTKTNTKITLGGCPRYFPIDCDNQFVDTVKL